MGISPSLELFNKINPKKDENVQKSVDNMGLNPAKCSNFATETTKKLEVCKTTRSVSERITPLFTTLKIRGFRIAAGAKKSLLHLILHNQVTHIVLTMGTKYLMLTRAQVKLTSNLYLKPECSGG